MTYTPNWPTREEWEASTRRQAESMIRTGQSNLEGDWPSWTDDERAEVESLLPIVAKQVRASCSRAGREARKMSPLAAELFGRKVPKFFTLEEVEAWRDPVESLQGDDKVAYDLLVAISNTRGEVSMLEHWEPRRAALRFAGWPADLERPASPEISRLAELVGRATERHQEGNRNIGRRMLADLEAPGAWEKELQRRAELEDYFRRGPVSHVHRA